MCERTAESYLSLELCSIFSLPPLPPWHGRKVRWESEMMGFASCKRCIDCTNIFSATINDSMCRPDTVACLTGCLTTDGDKNRHMSLKTAVLSPSKEIFFLKNHSLNVRMMYFLHYFVFSLILFVPLSHVHYPVERKHRNYRYNSTLTESWCLWLSCALHLWQGGRC